MQNIFILVLLALLALVSQQRYHYADFDHVHQEGTRGLRKIYQSFGGGGVVQAARNLGRLWMMHVWCFG